MFVTETTWSVKTKVFAIWSFIERKKNPDFALERSIWEVKFCKLGIMDIYNSLKQNGVNIIIENEKEFLKENEQEKKVFYTLVNTYKNIIDKIYLIYYKK